VAIFFFFLFTPLPSKKGAVVFFPERRYSSLENTAARPPSFFLRGEGLYLSFRDEEKEKGRSFLLSLWVTALSFSTVMEEMERFFFSFFPRRRSPPYPLPKGNMGTLDVYPSPCKEI